MDSYDSLIPATLKNCIVLDKELSNIIKYYLLGCYDEDASLDEKAQSILYYYPENETLEKKIELISYIEGVMDFSYSLLSSNIKTLYLNINRYLIN